MTPEPEATATARRSALDRSEFPEDRFEAVEPGRSGRFHAILFSGLLLLATVAWILAGRRIEAPWIMGDELTYSEYAKSFADSGEFLFREQETRFLSIYPALIAPAWLADSVETAYSLAKAINAVLMVSAAIPLFMWARRLVTPALAYLPVVLLLVMPSFVYTGNLMTESAFLPAFLLATFLVALALERPTPLRQLLAAGAIGLAALVRLQGVVFLVIVPTAVVLAVLLDLRAEGREIRPRAVLDKLRPYLPAALVAGVALLVYAIVSAARGSGLGAALGTYQDVPEANYSASEVLRWTVTHLGELSLSVGLIPVSAFVVLLALAWQRASTFTAAQRAFLAVSAAALPWIVVQVAAFASVFSERVEERNMFYLAPLLFLALALWIARGLPRPARTTAVAVALPAGLLVALPMESLFNISLRTSTFGLIPFQRISDLLGGVHDARVMLAAGAVAAALLFAAFSRWLATLVIPVALVSFLALSAYSVSGSSKQQSHGKRFAFTLGPNANWIDDRLGPDGNAALLFTPLLNADADVALQSEFWNRSVRDVYALDGPAYTFTGIDVKADPLSGLIATATSGDQPRPPYAVADTASVSLAGELVTQNGRLGLFRLDGPLRQASRSEGVHVDGWSGADATYSRYWSPGNAAGTIDVEISRAHIGYDVPRTDVRVEVGPLVAGANGKGSLGRVLASRSASIRVDDVKTLRLSTPPPPFQVRLHVDRTFSPVDYGQPDTRQLGVRTTFRFRPR